MPESKKQQVKMMTPLTHFMLEESGVPVFFHPGETLKPSDDPIVTGYPGLWGPVEDETSGEDN